MAQTLRTFPITEPAASAVRLERLPRSIASAAPMDVAERFRDRPGLALLESARPGRRSRWTFLTADPLVVLEAASAGVDPFADARRQIGRAHV